MGPALLTKLSEKAERAQGCAAGKGRRCCPYSRTRRAARPASPARAKWPRKMAAPRGVPGPAFPPVPGPAPSPRAPGADWAAAGIGPPSPALPAAAPRPGPLRQCRAALVAARALRCARSSLRSVRGAEESASLAGPGPVPQRARGCAGRRFACDGSAEEPSVVVRAPCKTKCRSSAARREGPVRGAVGSAAPRDAQRAIVERRSAAPSSMAAVVLPAAAVPSRQPSFLRGGCGS